MTPAVQIAFQDELRKIAEFQLKPKKRPKSAPLLNPETVMTPNVKRVYRFLQDRNVIEKRALLDEVRDKHWNRNRQNRPPSTLEEAKKKRWGEVSPFQAVFHRMGSGAEGNTKWLAPSGKGEAVYDDKGKLVTTPINEGTFNWASPKSDQAGHAVKDILPYLIWGNRENDPTTAGERLTALLRNPGDPLRYEAALRKDFPEATALFDKLKKEVAKDKK